MFIPVCKSAWRSLTRYPQSSILQVIGLAGSLAGALLIFLWVQDESSIDGFHRNSRQLYQVLQHGGGDGSLGTFDVIPFPAARLISEAFPEVELSTFSRRETSLEGILSTDSLRFRAQDLQVSPDFFKVFSFELLQGDPQNIFSDQHHLLLSDQLARKLFGSLEAAMGQSVSWERSGQRKNYTISGLFAAPSSRSSLQFDLLLPFISTDGEFDWGGSNTTISMLLRPGTDAELLSQKITDLIFRERPDWINPFQLQRFSERYLYNRYENGVLAGGRIVYIRLFSWMGIFILFLAAINFMILSTAKVSAKLRESGIRKILGAARLHLIRRELTESLLISFLALLLALLLVQLLWSPFNEITGKQLSLLPGFAFLWPAVGIALLTGLLAGSYPAWQLSKPSALTALSGQMRQPALAGSTWKGLVVFQFALSAFFLSALIVVYRQLTFVNTIDLGYQRDQVLSFRNEGPMAEHLPAFMSELRRLPGVEHAAAFENTMTGEYGATFGVDWDGKAADDHTLFGIMLVDYGLIETLDLEMAAGRSFSRDLGAESGKIIFNQAAINAMGLQDPIGKMVRLDMWGEEKEIVGVVKDFHFESLYQQVKPCFMLVYPDGRNILARIKAGTERQTLARMQDIYETYNPGLTFHYTFLQENYRQLYAAETRLSALLWYCTGLALLISCLGLFGLVAFVARNRQKEIAIRRVVGATVGQIAVLLSRTFVRLVLLGLVLALPLTYWILQLWLRPFAYRIAIGADIFMLTTSLVLLLTLLTISAQIMRAAVSAPVKSLQRES